MEEITTSQGTQTSEIGSVDTGNVAPVESVETSNPIEQNTQTTTIPEMTNVEEKKDDTVQPEEEKQEPKPEEKQESKEEEVKEFNPDEIDFDNMTPYDDIEGYNFSSLAKEYGIDMSDEDALNEVKAYAKKIKDAGFTQEQADLFFKTQLDNILEAKRAEEELYKPSNIIKNLKEHLSIEEQRNYKPILNWINQSNKSGALPQKMINDAMANPTLVKFLNVLYKNSTSNTPVEVPKPVVKGGISSSTAVEKYKEWMNSQPSASQESVKQYVLGLQQMVDQNNIDEFNAIFKSILN